MIAVEYPNMVETFKRAMHEVLAEYFDGTVHVLGGLDLPFPLALPKDIRFDVRPFEQGPKLTIALAGDTTVGRNRYKCLVRGVHGYELRATILRTAIVVAPMIQPHNVDAQQLVDTAWSRMHNLFHMGIYEFSDRNIHAIEFSELPDDVVKQEGLIEASGVFKAELRVEYLAHNPI